MTAPDPRRADLARLARLLSPMRDETLVDRAAHLPASVEDWQALIALANRHRVVPALAEAVRGFEDRLPTEMQRYFNEARHFAILEELALLGTVRSVIAACQEDGVAIGILKGVPLSLQIHGRLGLRTSRDIDLFVTPDQVGPVLARLGQLGFHAESDLSPGALGRLMRSRKDLELRSEARRQIVELHWRLFDNPHLLAMQRMEGFVRTQLPMGLDCLLLSPDLNLRYLAIHGCQHGWSRLKWLMDFAAMAMRLSPDDLTALYDATGIGQGRRALGQALLLCAQLFAMPLPADLSRAIDRQRRIRWLVEMAHFCMTTGGAAELEQQQHGTTGKNLSHYLISASPRYLAAELSFDLNDVSAEPLKSQWRRFGALGRLGGWMSRQWQ